MRTEKVLKRVCLIAQITRCNHYTACSRGTADFKNTVLVLHPEFHVPQSVSAGIYAWLHGFLLRRCQAFKTNSVIFYGKLKMGFIQKKINFNVLRFGMFYTVVQGLL